MAGGKLPFLDPNSIINGITRWADQNFFQIIIIVLVGGLIAGYIIYLIIEEYHRNPIRHLKIGKMGKWPKISDMIRKKH